MPDKRNAFCVPHEVRMTADKGLGVFAREPIEQGRIVWRHTPGIFRVYDEPSFRANIDGMSPAEELTTDYMSDDDGPEYYDALYERFGVREDYLPGSG